MRVAFLLAVVVLASLAAPQAQDFIPAVYLSAKYVAPQDAPSSIVVAGKEEPGERMIVTGQATARGKSLAGVSVYVFHADAAGLYTRDGGNSDENARLHGALRTDADGRYRYETIRPSGYGNNPAHLHHVVSAPGYQTRLRDYWFADDPLTVKQCKADLPRQPGYCGLVGPVTRDASGVWHATHDFEMAPE
jgi:protocatechuate 3,4-dioxygenase beta subunit